MAKAFIKQAEEFGCKCSWINSTRNAVLLLLTLFLTSSRISSQNGMNSNVAINSDLENKLKLSLSSNKQLQPLQDSSYGMFMNQILTDDYRNDFSQTTAAIQFITNSLENFAQLAQIYPENFDSRGKIITNWLNQQSATLSSQQYQEWNPMISRMANELDFVYSSFWTPFSQLLQKIITERPPTLNDANLDFRCNRYNELNALMQISSSSSIYRLVLDIFSTELYTHCLIRKLAILKLYHIKPSSILRQFVDIYLDLPPINHEGRIEERLLTRLRSNQGPEFDLQESLKRHGPLEEVAELVLDEQLSFLYGGSRSIEDLKKLVERFKRDCRRHRSDLEKVWSTFDDMASYLSSPSNDLSSFNEAIKFNAPQLTYGIICGHLE